MKRILFVDDEPMILRGIKSMLYRRRNDWEMMFAEGGAAAIEILKREHVDAVVTDLRMPGVDGVKVLRAARDHSPEAVRIVLSGLADEQQTVRLVAVAQQFLNKPCEPGKLEAIIDRCFTTQSLIASDVVRGRLGGAGALPPVPTTFAKLQAVLGDERADMKAVARVVESDPAIVAKILQVVNSAFFRLPRRVSSVEQAVTYLGASSIRDLTLAAELFQSDSKLPQGIDPVQIQAHAFRIATLARMVSRGQTFADDCFLAGLVHDVGLLLLGKEFPAEMSQAIAASAGGESLFEAESRLVGIDHGTAGAYLLGVWGLSYEVIEAVAHHHAPQRVSQDSLDVLASVCIAEALLAQIDDRTAVHIERNAVHVDAEYLKRLGVQSSWPELIDQARIVLAEDKGL